MLFTLTTRPITFAKTEKLRNAFEFFVDSEVDTLFETLFSFNQSANLFYSVEKVIVPRFLSEPADHFWALTDSTDYMWYLKKIQAEEAWNITKGDTSVKVAIVDSGVDINHPDLIGKIDPPYDFYNGQTFTSNNYASHGTTVATLIAAETIEAGGSPNGQMPSIGWNTKVMMSTTKSAGADTVVSPGMTQWIDRADIVCLYASTVKQAKVLNISWNSICSEDSLVYESTFPNFIESLILIEKEILNNGTTIIKGAGNGNYPCFDGGISWPFSGREDPRTIIVSGSGPDDRHLNTLGGGINSHSHYPEVDLCAPSYKILAGISTLDNDSNYYDWPYATYGGTSQSAPLVSGTAALMYSVNPCLTPSWVQDILKNTTDPIVDADDYPGLVGTGRLNAYNAVRVAQESNSQTLDLFIKDRLEDFGNEQFPYHWQAARDKSPDMWVRNQADGRENQEHQDPEFTTNQPVYVYVRVRNKSCATAVGNEKLSLYWSKASGWSSWPQNWDGTQPTIGNQIGSLDIGTLAPGRDTIIEFQWNILNPNIHENWATCLLARIENSPTDGITIHPDRLDDDVFFNNNIAHRNVTIIDVIPGLEPPGVINNIYFPHGKYVFIGNATSDEQVMDIELLAHRNKNNESIVSQAEVKLIFDDAGWNQLKDQIASTSGLRIIRDKEVILVTDSIILKNVPFTAYQRFPLYIGFSFLSDRNLSDDSFDFQIREFLPSDTALLGGVYYTINRYQRAPFSANAGNDREILQGETVAISAENIGEAALYNWYDEEGNLIYQGKDFSVSPEISRKYKLEVITSEGGYKDYDSLDVKVKKFYISNINPNPSSDVVNVEYKATDASSAYLMVLNQTATQSHNFILNTNLETKSLDLSDLLPGSYTIILVCDGVAKDGKSLIVQ